MTTIRSGLYNIALRLTGKTAAYLDVLRDNQWQTPRAVERDQKRRLEHLLRHAYDNTRYYHRLLREVGIISASGAVNFEHFNRIPPLTKELIRENFDDLLDRDLADRKSFRYSSGGTTGQPVSVMLDAAYKDWVRAVKLLFDEWTGLKPGDRRLLLWAAPRDWSPEGPGWRTHLQNWLKNERWISTRRIQPAATDYYLKLLDEFRPVQFLGFAESVYELACILEDRRDDVTPPGGIMTSAGTLYPYMRRKIEAVFDAPLFNRYGCREVGDIACDCEAHEGLHVSAPTHHVEVLRADDTPADPGEEGEIVVTSLVNYAMPLIRYRIGDIGARAAGPCSCGRGWPLLQRVTGRVTDTFILRDGTRVRPNIVWLTEHPWIIDSQVIQENYDLVRVVLVSADHQAQLSQLSPQQTRDVAAITEKIQAVMGEDVVIKVELTDKLEPSPSGKHLHIFSKVRRA